MSSRAEGNGTELGHTKSQLKDLANLLKTEAQKKLFLRKVQRRSAGYDMRHTKPQVKGFAQLAMPLQRLEEKDMFLGLRRSLTTLAHT